MDNMPVVQLTPQPPHHRILNQMFNACDRLRMHAFMRTFVKCFAVLWILRHYNFTRFIIILIIIILN